MAPAVFTIDGDGFMPAPEARAAWYPDALHGGPVAALFTREIERTPSPVPMQITRLTVEMLRPIPTRRLTVETRVVRSGGRVEMVDATMQAEGTVAGRASALRIREADVPVPDHPQRPQPAPVAGLAAATVGAHDEPWYHTSAVEIRFASGDFWEPGPADAWARLVMPLVEGEEPSPIQRVAALADFGNGISHVVGFDEYVYINPDLTVYLDRRPVGEWICLRSRTDLSERGIGLAQSELFDERGAIGHALQSLYVDTRAAFGR